MISRDASATPADDDSLDALRAEARRWARKPRRRGFWYATEDMLRANRTYGSALLIAAFAQPILYLLGLVLGLATLIPQRIEDAGASVSYVTFVAPALLVTAALAVAAEEFASPVLAGFTQRQSFSVLATSPLSPGQIANGLILAAIIRMTVVTVAFYAIVWAIGAVPAPATGWIGIPAAVVGALTLGFPLMGFASSLTEDDGRFALVQRVVFIPLVFFSGTFYPLSALPGWLTWVGWLSPVWHASELARVASYGEGEDRLATLVHIVFIALFAVIGYVLARRAFLRRLDDA